MICGSKEILVLFSTVIDDELYIYKNIYLKVLSSSQAHGIKSNNNHPKRPPIQQTHIGENL